MNARELLQQLAALPEEAMDLRVLISVSTSVAEVVVLDQGHPSGPAVALL